MNNEETIVMKPQNKNKAEQTQNVETTETQSNKGKKVAATAAAAVMGGVVGGGATYAATEMLHDKEAEEQKPEEEAQASEEPVAATTEEPQKEQHNETPKEEVAVKVDEEANVETDYTGHNGADPVTPNPEVHAAVNETSDTDTNEVQVLGVYEAQGDQGQTMQVAVLTDGEDVAAVVDLDGEGTADVLLHDNNRNGQIEIEEGEVYDISNDHIQMSHFQDTYLAQQQEQMQQEHDTFAYNASDDQQDYNNDADLSFA